MNYSRRHFPHRGDHLASIEVDAAPELFMGKVAGTVFHVETGSAERLHRSGNSGRDGFGRAVIERFRPYVDLYHRAIGSAPMIASMSGRS